MTFLAYLLSIILVPVLSTAALIFTLPLVFLMKRLPRIFALCQGILIGIFAGWCCYKIFFLCGVSFSNTPLIIIGFLFLLNDFSRVGKARGKLSDSRSEEFEKNILDDSNINKKSLSFSTEICILIGTQWGLVIWANWLT